MVERSQEEYKMIFGTNEKSDSILTPEQYNMPNQVRNASAKANTNLFGFIKQVQKVCNIVMPEVTIIPDDERDKYITPKIKIETPFITFKVKKRTPLKERKFMERHEFLEETDVNSEARIGTLFAQRFKCYIQFNLFANGYTLVEDIMDKFESILLDYAGSFKEQGIVDIFFDEQIEDDKYETYRQVASVRHLIYLVIFEKQKITYDQVIHSVESNLIAE